MKKLLTVSVLLVMSLFSFVVAKDTSRMLVSVHYRFILTVGDIPMMLNASQAKGATSGEVTVNLNGMGMNGKIMGMGMKANRHLELIVIERRTGKRITNVMPGVRVKNAAGKIVFLNSMMQMYDVTKGRSDLHFGTNLNMANGRHTVRISFKGETVVFKNISR
jgi:hypothetical protein